MKIYQLLLAIVMCAVISGCNSESTQSSDVPDSPDASAVTEAVDTAAQDEMAGDEAAMPAESSDVSGNPDFTPVTMAVDTNGDGQMSREEWTAAGLPMSSFNGFENGRDYVTQEDYEKGTAPGGIDINGDGKLTVEEFIEFDKSMSAGGGPGGDAPAGGPPGDAPDMGAPAGGAPDMGAPGENQ